MPAILTRKLTDLDFSTQICEWIYSFSTDCQQTLWVGSHMSSTLSLSMVFRQGWVLSPFLFIQYAHNCVHSHHSNTIVKFADNTTVVGLSFGRGETMYTEEVQRLEAWCSGNNLLLNTGETKDVVMDWRRKREGPVFTADKWWLCGKKFFLQIPVGAHWRWSHMVYQHVSSGQ